MSKIKTVAPEAADERLKEIYERIARERGGVAEIHKALSLRPELVEKHFEFYKAVMLEPEGGLSRKERELIAVTVSLHNGSAYCAAHHGKALDKHGGDMVNLSYHRPVSSGTGVDLREQALLEYTKRLTLEPTKVTDADFEKLRSVGFTDLEILDMTAVISYFCCINRIASALDVDLEKNYEQVCG